MALRDDIKSSGKFAIFSYLKIEGGRGSTANYGKMAPKNLSSLSANISRIWELRQFRHLRYLLHFRYLPQDPETTEVSEDAETAEDTKDGEDAEIVSSPISWIILLVRT